MGRSFFSVTILLLFVQSTVFAETLKPVLLYKRCYAHLTGTVPELTDSRTAAILAGTKTASAACKEIVDLINIDSTTGLLTATPATEDYKIAKLALNHMYNAMRTWSKMSDLGSNFSDYYTWFASTEEFYDFTGVAVMLAENLANSTKHPKNLFEFTSHPYPLREKDEKYKKTFTINSIYSLPGFLNFPYSYRYRRDIIDAIPDANIVSAARSRYGIWFGNAGTPNNPDDAKFALESATTTIFNSADSKAKQIQTGELIGIKDSSPSAPITATTYIGSVQNINIDGNATIGKGLLGLKPYIMMNGVISDQNSVRPNLLFMPRRLIQNVIQDFLCRDLPVLRENDILSYMSTDSNALPFRTARSCVACHTTMDQAASTLRGLRYDYNYRRSDPMEQSRAIVQVHLQAPDAGGIPGDSTNTNSANLWSDKQDDYFYKRPSIGKFVFRSFDGKFTNIALNNYGELADEFAKTDDAYVCLSKKMFKQMTGIDVKMFDAGDPRNSSYMQSLSSQDWKYRDFVIKQGLELKKTGGHMKTLIKAIIDSPYYQASDYGKSGVTP